MRLIFITFIYYIKALAVYIGTVMVMKMKPSSSVAARFSRFLERAGENLTKKESVIKESITKYPLA